MTPGAASSGFTIPEGVKPRLEWIAEEALKRGTGARALRAILEEFMLDIMYEIPKDPNIGSVVVTRPYLEKSGGPLIQMRG